MKYELMLNTEILFLKETLISFVFQMIDAKVHQLDYVLERITLSLKEITVHVEIPLFMLEYKVFHC